MPPQYDGHVWYQRTLDLLEGLLSGGRLDFIAREVQETVTRDHERRGWKRRPRVSPQMVLGEAVRRGYLSDEEAMQHLRWHRQEQMRKKQLERNIPADLQSEIFTRDGGRCQYCGGEGRTLDHLVPVSKGGPSVRLNLLTACEPCNLRKHAKLPSEEIVTVIRFFLKRERTVENGYPYMAELIRQFYEQLEQKGPFEQARIRGIVGIKKSTAVRQERRSKNLPVRRAQR